MNDYLDGIVFICERCGAGILRPTSERHVEPMWLVLSTNEQGEDCFGRIIPKQRKELICE